EPAYVADEGLVVEVPHYGRVRFDLVWSGAYYALVEADRHGFALAPEEQIALTAFGDAFVRAARPGLVQEHPHLGDVGPLPFEPAYVADAGLVVEVPHYGRVRVDLVWSGAYYALVEADRHGFALAPEEQIALTAFGDAFVRAARPGLVQEHPHLGDVGPLPFA